jgi:hypothetical protein
MARVRTLAQAAKWVDKVGLALLFPKADVVLPSLWEQVNGSPAENWAVRGPDGTFVRWTDEMGILWDAKDELPRRGLVCVGKHVARVSTCIAPRLVPTVVAALGRDDVEGLEAEIVAAVRTEGPLTAPQLRVLTGAAKKDVDKAVTRLQHALVLTHDVLVRQEQGWGAIAVELLARKWPLPATLPARNEAQRDLAELVLDAAGDLTAADLGGVLGLRLKAAAAILDEIAESREEDGFRIWARP